MYKNLNAVVVDDYDMMRQHLCKILQQLGLNIFEARNGQEALEVIRQNKPDIVFTDIVMPIMDGFELCEVLRKSSDYIHVPIVVLSTHCDTHYINKVIHQGADDFIPKPAKAEIVKTVLNRVLTQIIPVNE